MTKENPCIFKRECKTCVQTLLKDRPVLCQNLECQFYTPCKTCGMNRILDKLGFCNVCAKEARSKREQEKAELEFLNLDKDGDLVKSTANLQAALDAEEDVAAPRKVTVSMPGTPPSEYSNDEKEIYLSQWAEYKGFYRDPTAKAVLHGIIILEIELNWVLNEMISSRGKVVKDLEQQRLRIIRSLGELHGQLPKREANDESDDEKFLSMVYERYIAELKDRRVGKVSRILSPEAIALAPTLTFPLDPQKLLVNLGYRTLDAINAIEHISLVDLPKEPEKILEFFGYFLTEKYALPLNEQPDFDDDEPALPAVADPTLVTDTVEDDE